MSTNEIRSIETTFKGNMNYNSKYEIHNIIYCELKQNRMKN